MAMQVMTLKAMKAMKTGKKEPMMTKALNQKVEKLEQKIRDALLKEKEAQKKLTALCAEADRRTKLLEAKLNILKKNTGIVCKAPKWMTKTEGTVPKHIPIDMRGLNTIY